VFDWIDEWDFRNCQTKQYTHGFHTYPATFIPQIAKKLISVFSTEGDTVCDIFCGSGTTLVESSLLNRNAIGIELNPLAVLIAKVKTTPVEPAILKSDLIEILSCYNDIEPHKTALMSQTQSSGIHQELVKQDTLCQKKALFCLRRINLFISNIPLWLPKNTQRQQKRY
jgi:hypothetical protein